MKILIVGAGSGIGRAIYGRVGSGNIVFAPSQRMMDIADEESIVHYLTVNGPFNQIVSTAGTPRLAWAQDLHMQDFVDDFKINAFGFALLVGAHARLFKQQYPVNDHPRPFSAVAVVSDAHKNSMRGSLTYCSSKAALVMIIKGLARELAPHCQVNGVSPAVVGDTPMTDWIDATVPVFRGWEPSKAAAYEKSMLPMGRRTTKDEVAQVVLAVLNGPAYMTGSIVEIPGGKS